MSLTKAEKDFIAYMEKDEQALKRGARLIDIGENADHLHVLKFGWLVARSDEEAGRSAITRIYIPGEVVGMAEIGKGQALHSLTMHTDGCVCPFPRSAVAEMFSEVPRLAALLFSIGSLDQLELRRRVKKLTRMDAEKRMSSFLLTMQDRLAVANSSHSRRFHLPLSNRDLGNFLGMTDIYVGRILKRFIASGRIRYEDRHVTILNRKEWGEAISQNDIYASIDTEWYPEPRADNPKKMSDDASRVKYRDLS